MLQGFIRVAFVGVLVFTISTSARAATYKSCPAGAISYYSFVGPVPVLLEQQEYFQGPVIPLDGGPAEPRIAREMVTDPALAVAKGDILYGVCSAQVGAFEALMGVVTRVKISAELYQLKDAAGADLAVRFTDFDQNAQGGGVAIQGFFHCSTVTVNGFIFNDWPMILNTSIFHTGADVTAINATAGQISQYWTGPLRNRIRAASEAWMAANTACVPIDKAEFSQLVDTGKVPLVEYHVIDPTHNVDGEIP